MRNRGFLFKAFIIFIIVVVLYFIVLLLYNYVYNDPDDQWGIVDDNSKYDSDSLYDSETVIKLDRLFKNSNFITQVKTNKLSYLYGFNSTGEYLVTIHYDNKTKDGYILNINNIITDENAFSIFIPDNVLILESKEFAYAKELVEIAYKVTIPANKLDWDDIFIYENERDFWYFKQKIEEKKTIFSISTSKDDSFWEILLDNQGSSLVYTEIFGSSIRDDILTFVFYFDQFNTGISNCRIITIDLNRLINSNCEKGKFEEADKWLYGEFVFIYNQWEKFNKRGFLAISYDDDNILAGEDLFYKQVGQWVYMDMTGKMQWYGNSEGIFNSIGEPVVLAKGGYYYDLNLIEYDNKGLTYYVVDIYNNTDNRLIKTIEFVWDIQQKYMVPILYEDLELEVSI